MISRLNRLLLILVACFFVPNFGCDRSSPVPSSPFYFADHVDEAVRDFDQDLFLSFRKDGRLSGPITLGPETKLSLLPALPSRLTYSLTVPPEPSLRFSIGVSTLGEELLPEPIDFLVQVETNGSETTCFEGNVLRRSPNRWFDHEVDLTPWVGKTIRITLETKYGRRKVPVDRPLTAREGQSFIPSWGNPVLTSKSARPGMPPIVLISVDCLRADHVGVYGYPRSTTPNIDRFARDGVVFKKAMSVSSWTLPVHMSMLTGVMPSQHGLTRYHRLRPTVPYLPQVLIKEGYETLGVVSGAYLSPTFGYHEGFRDYRYLNDRSSKDVVEAALDSIRRSSGRPVFLFLHLFDAHWPYQAPQGYRDRFGERLPDISNSMRKVLDLLPPDNAEELQGLKDLYDGEIAYIDEAIGELFDRLEAMGLYDEALIILTADHGEGFYEHEDWQHANLLYEEVIHVPLIVKWPHRSRAGEVDSLVSHLDIFPTILETADIHLPLKRTDSLAAVHGEKSRRTRTMSEITWEPNDTRGAYMKIALRTDELKYIAIFAGKLDDPEFVSEMVGEELYDLAKDPAEKINLLPEVHEELEGFREEVRVYLDEVRVLRAKAYGEKIQLDQDLLEELKALGYVNQ